MATAQSAPPESCGSFAAQQASLFAAAGAATGFFRVHAHSKTLSLAEKNRVGANLLASAGRVAGPVGYYTAVGLAFSGAQCLAQQASGERDAVSGIIGGAAAGAVVGLRRASLPAAVGFGMLFASGSLLADFLVGIATPVLGSMAVKNPATQPAQ